MTAGRDRCLLSVITGATALIAVCGTRHHLAAAAAAAPRAASSRVMVSAMTAAMAPITRCARRAPTAPIAAIAPPACAPIHGLICNRLRHLPPCHQPRRCHGPICNRPHHHLLPQSAAPSTAASHQMAFAMTAVRDRCLLSVITGATALIAVRVTCRHLAAAAAAAPSTAASRGTAIAMTAGRGRRLICVITGPTALIAACVTRRHLAAHGPRPCRPCHGKAPVARTQGPALGSVSKHAQCTISSG